MPIQGLARRTARSNRGTWLEDAKKGSATAAQKLFDCYGSGIRRGIARSLPSSIRPRIDIEDLMQEARIVLLRKPIPAWIEVPRDFARYAAQVARRETLAAIRNHAAAKCRSVLREVPIKARENDLIATESSVVDTCSNNDLWYALIHDAPPSFRKFLELLRQGNSLRQIARITEMDEELVLDIVLASLKTFRGATRVPTKKEVLRLFADAGCPIRQSLTSHLAAWANDIPTGRLHVVDGINQAMTRRQRRAFESLPSELMG